MLIDFIRKIFANCWKDTGASWRDWYEDDKFEANIDKLWDDVKPLYGKLHGYVRFVMNQKYGDDYVKGRVSEV